MSFGVEGDRTAAGMGGGSLFLFTDDVFRMDFVLAPVFLVGILEEELGMIGAGFGVVSLRMFFIDIFYG